jgi:hypothetical protein
MSQRPAGVPTPQEEMIRAREATRATLVRTTEASAHKFTVTRENVTTLVRDMEDRAALAKREAQEMVSRAEAGSTATLASAL